MSANKCIFECESTEGKIIDLTQDSYEQIKKASKIRKHFNLKYSELDFPEVSEGGGYHRICRKNFVKLEKVYVDEYDQGRFIYIYSRVNFFVYL